MRRRLIPLCLLLAACSGAPGGGESGSSEDDAGSGPGSETGDTSGPSGGPDADASGSDGGTSDDDGTSDSSDDSGSGTTGEPPPPCEGEGFAADAVAWSLPDGYGDAAFVDTFHAYCLDGSQHHATFDLTGDGAPDLVVTDDCQGSAGTWLVYENNGDGFGSNPIQWSLPDGYGDAAFVDTFHAYCLDGSQHHATLDLTGDGAPDLVVTDDCSGSAGTWLVYENTGDGFANDPIQWSLPAGYGDAAFVDTFHAYCLDGSQHHATLDLTGDGAPDLVVTDDCNGSAGTWLVYRNDGDGFSADPVQWSLPPGYNDAAFIDTSHAYCLDNSQHHSTMDLTGDGAPDLVVTDDCQGSAGTWLLYTNNGDGFASDPIDWDLPPGYHDAAFIDPFHAYCLDNSQRHATFDITGDALPDLIVTDDCQGSAGTWLVYRNEATSFAADPLQWSLPPDYGDAAFIDTAHAYCLDNSQHHSTFDLTGEGRPDLVVTDDCNGSAGTWLLYENLCPD